MHLGLIKDNIQTKCESFGQAFSKACGFSRRRLEAPSAEGEMTPTAFLFVNFFFARSFAKEKVAIGFCSFQFFWLFLSNS